jgi:hypothetical protein
VTVLRTAHLMSTVSAYGAIDRYGRGQVSRGGSITNLWIEGFGPTGFAQSSSVSIYRREEDIHMPDEPALQPLTPRAECTIDGVYYSTLFEAEGRMSVTQEPGVVVVTTEGRLRSRTGAAAGVEYRLTHRFSDDRVTKEWTFTSPHPQVIRLVEPFVRDPALVVTQTTPRQVHLGFGGDKGWTFAVERHPAGSRVTCDEDTTPYWSPFPGVNGQPIVVTLTTTAGQPTFVETSFGPER